MSIAPFWFGLAYSSPHLTAHSDYSSGRPVSKSRNINYPKTNYVDPTAAGTTKKQDRRRRQEFNQAAFCRGTSGTTFSAPGPPKTCSRSAAS